MFDLRRFARLAGVQWAEYGRTYLWFLGIGIAVHLCVWLLVTTGGRNAEIYTFDTQFGFYACGYLVTGCLFALRYFSALSNRESALTFLMRPASTIEKLLLAFLVVAVLYPLAYTLAFQVCNLPGALIGEATRDAKLAAAMLNADPESMWLRDHLRSRTFGPYLPFTNADYLSVQLQLLLGTVAAQALILAGTLYFRKAAWLKTLVALFVIVVLALPLLAALTNASPGLLFWDNTSRADNPSVRAWLILVWAGVPVLFWTSIFFFLRERELQ